MGSLRYSDVKPLVKKLHQNGWSKIVGMSDYRKVWHSGSLRYGQMLDFGELLHAEISVNEILTYYESKASNAFDSNRKKYKSETDNIKHMKGANYGLIKYL